MAALQLPPMGALENLDQEWLSALMMYGRTEPFAIGEIIIQQGTAQESFYVVVEGELEAVTQFEGKEIWLSKITTGECFGEVSIFEPGPASATVRAKTAGTIWKMGADNLQNFLSDHPHAGFALLLGISQVLSRRLRRANETIKSHHICPSFLSIRAKKKVT